MIIKFDPIDKLVNIDEESNWVHLRIANKKQYFSVLKAIETEDNKQIQLYSEEYDLLDINNKFDFIGNPVVACNINEKYIFKIRKWVLEQINPIQKEKLQILAGDFARNIEQQLFLLELPISIDFEVNYIDLLKAYNLHIEPDVISKPYDIIYLVMKLHSIFNPESILCLNDLANYLDEDELKELKKESSFMKVKMILIN